MTEKLRLPELQPAHPSNKFTMEEAMAALEEVEAEERERHSARRRRSREARKPADVADSGKDP